jgi:hypothetical protein
MRNERHESIERASGVLKLFVFQLVGGEQAMKYWVQKRISGRQLWLGFCHKDNDIAVLGTQGSKLDDRKRVHSAPEVFHNEKV